MAGRGRREVRLPVLKIKVILKSFHTNSRRAPLIVEGPKGILL